MKKHWKLIYLIVSSALFVLIALICSLGFFKSNVSSLTDKHNFESIYLNTEFDFVIPSPSFEQVEILENEQNGIKTIVPYYAFSTSLQVNNSSIQSNIVMFDDFSKIESTPYNSKRVVKGDILQKENVAIIDKLYAEKNNCNVGDSISLQIHSNAFSFEVVAITENNTAYDGSVALVISNLDSKEINKTNFKYGAAYVVAENYQECKTYLFNEYKPLGRLKDKSEFMTEEAYDTHFSNFNNADWSKEVTDMKANYEQLSVRYDNVASNVIVGNIISIAIYIVSILAFNLIVIMLPSERKMFKELLTKKSRQTKDIISYNAKGNLFGMLVCMIVSLTTMGIILLSYDSLAVLSKLIGSIVMPIIAILVAFVINIVISNILLKKLYSR